MILPSDILSGDLAEDIRIFSSGDSDYEKKLTLNSLENASHYFCLVLFVLVNTERFHGNIAEEADLNA